MECPFELPVRLNKKGHFVCGEGESYRDLTPRLSMSSKHKLYIVQAINSHDKLIKHVEALKSVCEEYIPTDKMDEANSKVILLCMGNVEEIGRKLLSKQALEEIKSNEDSNKK